MRIIKFRGKHIEKGHWVYGHLLNDRTIGEVGIGLESYSYSEVIPESVGEFTGILASNKTEVYEGDIVRYGNEDGVVISEVIWDKSNDESLLISGFHFKVSYSREYNDDNEIVDMDVIGNTTDNPSLLNSEQSLDMEKQKERYEARQKSGSNAWSVFDNQRKVIILHSVSINATYNESVVKDVVRLLNTSTLTG